MLSNDIFDDTHTVVNKTIMHWNCDKRNYCLVQFSDTRIQPTTYVV